MKGNAVRFLRLVSLTLLALFVLTDSAGAARWYVDGSRFSSGDGTAWHQAFRTIQEAVDASTHGDTIWVAGGRYAISSSIFLLAKNLSIYGGFEGVETSLSQRDWVRNVTVIDGEGAVENCVKIQDMDPLMPATVIDGFTITGCTAGGSSSVGGGAQMSACDSAKPLIINVTFIGNGGPGYRGGGGLYLFDCAALILNTTFYQNQGGANGGAIFHEGITSALIVNSTFWGNSAYHGGAIANATGNMEIYNSILWSNTAGDGATHQIYGVTGLVDYNDIDQSGYGDTYNNIRQDPELSGVGRLYLRSSSPCIDAGTNSAPVMPLEDFDGDPRIVDGDEDMVAVADMGADELVPGALTGIWYVDGGVAASGSGTSWQSAFKTIGEGVSAASTGNEVWVKGGTYLLNSPVQLTPAQRGVGLYGGFGGWESHRSQRDWTANPTTLDGQGLSRCLHVNWASEPQTAADVVIDGFTVTRGVPPGAYHAALKIELALGVTVANCTFVDNDDTALSAIQSDIVVERSLFASNSGSGFSAGIWSGSDASGLAVRDSVFVDNSVTGTFGRGGAIGAYTGLIERSSFFGNSASRDGGAVYLGGSEMVVRNSEFSGNTAANWGGALTATQGTLTVENCTLWGNSAGFYGGLNATATSVIANSILWNNGAFNCNIPAASGRVTYSDVDNDGFGDGAGGQDAYGNLRLDPLLIDPDGADNLIGTVDDVLSLQRGSPVIDAGDNGVLDLCTLDLAGQPRFVDDPLQVDIGAGLPPIVDMGAYEIQVGGGAVSSYDLTVAAGEGGTTSPSPGVHTYPACTVVGLTALPDVGWGFDRWSGDVVDSTSIETTVPMTADRSCTAHFLALPLFADGFESGDLSNWSAAVP